MPCDAFIHLLIHISILGLLLPVKAQASGTFASEAFLERSRRKRGRKSVFGKKDDALRREKQFLFEMVSQKIMVYAPESLMWFEHSISRASNARPRRMAPVQRPPVLAPSCKVEGTVDKPAPFPQNAFHGLSAKEKEQAGVS